MGISKTKLTSGVSRKAAYQLSSAAYKTCYSGLFSLRAGSCVWVLPQISKLVTVKLFFFVFFYKFLFSTCNKCNVSLCHKC